MSASHLSRRFQCLKSTKAIGMINEVVAGFIRHAITALGGALVAAGYVNSEEWATIAGALAVLVGVVWSVIAKRIANSRTIPPST
jgi:uncharacterized membrane protein